MEKWILLILPIILTLGLFSGREAGSITSAVPSLFMLLTFLSSWNVNKKQFQELWSRPWVPLSLLVFSHLILPVVYEWMIAHSFVGQKDLQNGLFLALTMPIGVTSIVWVGLTGGNVGIAITLVTLDTLLSPVLIPLTLWVCLGETVRMAPGSMMVGLVKLVMLPCMLGIFFGYRLRKAKEEKQLLIRACGSLISKVTLYAIIFLNAAALSVSIARMKGEVAQVIGTVGLLMMLGYAGAWGMLHFWRLKSQPEIAYTYSGGIRNYTAGVVIAQMYFAPLTIVPVMGAMLLQHPLALLVHILYKRTSGSKAAFRTANGMSDK